MGLVGSLVWHERTRRGWENSHLWSSPFTVSGSFAADFSESQYKPLVRAFYIALVWLTSCILLCFCSPALFCQQCELYYIFFYYYHPTFYAAPLELNVHTWQKFSLSWELTCESISYVNSFWGASHIVSYWL